jgi:serine phosphatase RsbU (regulator of sigma subunit)
VEADAAVPPARINNRCSNASEPDRRAASIPRRQLAHLAPLLLRQDGAVERLGSTATVVGVFKEWDCSMAECQLFSGDTLVLYTDGVTESFNEAWEDFGEKRLIEGLETHRKLPPQAVIEAIVNRVKQFSPREQHDDITLIVGKCRGD